MTIVIHAKSYDVCLMTTLIKNIRYFPVKGLAGIDLPCVQLTAGQALPQDRRFALALGSTPIDQAEGEWMAKTFFLMLARNEKLATLETAYDQESEILTVSRKGRQVSRGKLTDTIGRAMIEEFFDAYMGDEARGRPKVIEGTPERPMSDIDSAVVSLINLASVRDIERITGKPVNPNRFRGNIMFEGETPWIEHDWIDQDIQIGDVRLNIFKRTRRCAATEVNPETAARDMSLLKALKMGFEHTDCGVYARVEIGGLVSEGDIIIPPNPWTTPEVL